MNPLEPVAVITGPFWTWVVPVALFLVALGATVGLYRHFVTRGVEGDRPGGPEPR